jgi:hypothetical protein
LLFMTPGFGVQRAEAQGAASSRIPQKSPGSLKRAAHPLSGECRARP